MDPMELRYKKRPGTSGMDGQLYETKLIGLILFRLLHDERVEQFYLGTNVDEVGAFDDICLQMNIVGRERPVALFVQVKHKDNNDKSLTLDNKADLVKWYNSVLKINRKIVSGKSSGKLFSGNVTEADCLFIVYTNAGFAFDLNTEFVSDYATTLNDVLATSSTPGFRPHFSEQHVRGFGNTIWEADLLLLVEHFVTFLNVEANKSMKMMLDECILQHHVVLKQRVVDVTNIQTDHHKPDLKWRTLTFQNSFFDTHDKHTALLRNHLFKGILKTNPRIRNGSDATQSTSKCSPTPEPSVDELISSFLTEPSAGTLTPLIITHIACNETGRLEFVVKRPPSDTERLREIYISRLAIDEAMLAARAAAAKYLRSLKVKVPITFGNVDLTVTGSPKKIERRLEYLATALVGLCKVYELQESYRVVTLDDSMDDGLSSPNGGLGGAVGNMLTYDEETKMIKFCNDFASLPNNAKTLFLKVRNQIDNIHEYRFDVKTTKLPKLHTDSTNVAKDFLSKLVVFAKQENHFEVEKILKKEIQDRLSANPHNCLIQSDSVLLHYHNKIQKIWMSKTGEYLTKTSNVYEQAISEIVTEPQISAIQTTFYMNNVKYCGYSFAENATKWMELPELPSKMFIVTDTVTLTTMKVTQCLRNHYAINKYIVLDLEHVLNLPKADFCSLEAELRKTQNVVIIVCSTHDNSISSIRLCELKLSTKDKNIIVIGNTALIERINEWFLSTNDVFEDETQLFTALTLESQRDVTQNAKVIFQDREVSFNLILDEVSVAFITGGVLDKVIRNETINMGTPLSNSRYEEFKYIYMDRRVTPVGKAPTDTSNASAIDDTEVNEVFYNALDDPNVIRMCMDIPLSNSRYEKFKYLYMDRRVTPVGKAPTDTSNASAIADTEVNEEVFYDALDDPNVVRTFNDIGEDVVLITAPPGMGKSTLLTHLALKTKDRDTSLWIVRVNFLNYSNQFYKWYEDKIVVDSIESLTFLCQAALGSKEMSISIEITNDEARLINCTGDELDTFKLNMFLHFYNKRRLIFVFDGFDEICPYYKDKVIDLIYVVKTSLRKKKMWVSSRPYSDILPDLERVLGRRFELQGFTFYEQDVYLKHFWSKNIIYEKLKSKRHTKLLESIWNTRHVAITLRCGWILRSAYSFFHFLHPFCYDKNKDDHNVMSIDQSRKDFSVVYNYATIRDTKSSIPLLLYFIADYYVNLVNIDDNHIEYMSELNSGKIYEVFIENKLKKILLQDKNSMDLSNPITRGIYEKELAGCLSIHKRLAAHALLQGPIFEKLAIEEMNPLNEGVEDFNALLSNIKRGVDKIGLISHVTADGVPVFMHRTFTEYLTAGYICDILKSDKFGSNKKTLLYHAIISVPHYFNVREWFGMKLQLEPELRHIIREIGHFQFGRFVFHSSAEAGFSYSARTVVCFNTKRTVRQQCGVCTPNARRQDGNMGSSTCSFRC